MEATRQNGRKVADFNKNIPALESIHSRTFWSKEEFSKLRTKSATVALELEAMVSEMSCVLRSVI
jgi:hypothetical protein